MIRLFIEDQELDVNQGFTNQITYAVDDLQNLDSKATAFSKTIVLPGTANNNRLLGNIFEFGTANFTVDGIPNFGYNFNASRSAKMKMEYNGVQVIKGTLRLLEIIIDGNLIEYEIALFGELGGFIAKLGNKKLEDLNFNEYNHTYTVANIISSWDNANNGYGYYYPLIDYGNVSVNKQDYDVRAFRPALFVKEIFDKIITENGYTWESNFFNSNFAKRLIIPNNQKNLLVNKSRILETDNQRMVGNTSTPYLLQGVSQTSYNQGLYTTLFYQGLFTTSDNIYFTWTGSNTTININTSLLFQIIVTKTGIIPLTNHNFQIIGFRDNGSSITEIGRSNNFNIPFSSYTSIVYNPIFNINWQFPLNTNDKIYFALNVRSSSGNYYVAASTNDNIIFNTAFSPILTPVELNDPITLKYSIPKNIFQKDFFASILKMFYLMVTEDKTKERHLIIEPWIDFYNNDRITYLDWSDKIDRSEPIRIKPMAELNARYYQLSYKSDNDWKNEIYRKLYNQGYGDRIYDNGFEFAKETDKTEVIFSATTLIGYGGVDKVLSSIFKMNNNVEEKMDSNIRILQAKKLTGYSAWSIKNLTATLQSGITDVPYAGHFDDPDAPNSDLNFGAPQELYYTLTTGALSNNLFNAYYSSYLAEITDKDSRVITVKMKLTESDIFNLDFGRYILIDQVLYRLSKIIDYAPGELCKVELLRVISTNYN